MPISEQERLFIRTNEQKNVSDLALKKSLFTGKNMPFLLAQIAGRQTAKHKIPTWYAYENIIYPVHLSLEQASSEMTARYKSTLISDTTRTFADLTGGLGVDFFFLAKSFDKAFYIEQSNDLCDIARENFLTFVLTNVEIKNKRAEDFLTKTDKLDFIFLDPARRGKQGGKVFFIEDCSPNVVDLKELLLQKANKILIKFSPMLDISSAVKTLNNCSEVHVVSVENECKELLFVLEPSELPIRYFAVNLKKNGKNEYFDFLPTDEQKIKTEYASEIGNYLYEPNASLLKAGAFNSIAVLFGLKKLHLHTHLYTSDKKITDFLGRSFRVKDVFSPNKQNIKKITQANITTRNYPLSVAQIRKQTKLKDGGDTYIFATTVATEKKMWIVCEKL